MNWSCLFTSHAHTEKSAVVCTYHCTGSLSKGSIYFMLPKKQTKTTEDDSHRVTDWNRERCLGHGSLPFVKTWISLPYA